MPFLALIWGAISTFAGTLFAQFLLIFGRKFTVGTASILAFVAATLAFILCIKTIILAVVAVIVMPAWISTAIAWFVPSNFVAVISQILAAKVCREAYDITVTKISLMNQAS